MVRRDACRGGGGEEGEKERRKGGEDEEAPTATASCYIGDLLVDQ